MPKILYVEDNEDNVYMLQRRLAKHGYEMVVAGDGAQGVEAAQREMPALILMDLSLPVLSGWDAARQLKSLDETRSIPIVALSAHALDGEEQKALEAGCDDFETKPCRPAASARKDGPLDGRRRVVNGAKHVPRILIVDDVDDNVFTLERRLRRFVEAEIASASNGRAALDQLQTTPFDLVLLDMQMPEMDGMAVLEQMKADMGLREIPVVMVSAVDDSETVLRCIKLGADDYVQKPFNPDLLRARVEVALDRKRLRDQEAGFLAQLQREKARANDLLHSVLPKSVVAELKANGRFIPRRHEDVAVLLCDIVGFTEYCDGNRPEAVVEALEALVSSFEAIVESHGLEKIKTIGDAFMATAGLLRYVENPALAAAECGLAMVSAAKEYSPGWQVRVGVHQGPVVAGVMGKRSFVFDLWGDTVNVAARIAAEAEPDTIVVTGATWPFLAAGSHGRSLGEFDLKGKGKTELVRYLGRR